MTRLGSRQSEGRCGHGPEHYRRRPDGRPYCRVCNNVEATAHRRRNGVTARGHFATTEAKFWSYIDRTSADGCWPWTGARDKNGYGRFAARAANGRASTVTAHRFALSLALGRKLEPHEYACHHCDNPPCARPDHLFVGTAKTNIEDAVAKRRMAFGDRNTRAHDRFRGMARPALSPRRIEIVRLALAEGIPGSDIALFLECSQAAVSRIRHGSRHASAA